MNQHFGNVQQDIPYINRAGTYGIHITAQDEVAVIKLEDDYFLPGGGIEQNESQAMCLHREFREETGYAIKINDYIGYNTHTHFSKRTGNHYYFLAHFYHIDLLEKVTVPIEENHTLLLLPIQEALQKLKLIHQRDAVQTAYQHKNTTS